MPESRKADLDTGSTAQGLKQAERQTLCPYTTENAQQTTTNDDRRCEKRVAHEE